MNGEMWHGARLSAKVPELGLFLAGEEVLFWDLGGCVSENFLTVG